MKKLIALAILTLSTHAFAEGNTNMTNSNEMKTPNVVLFSTKVDAYNNALDAPLLKKLKKGAALSNKDKARLEIIYQMKFSGEEELNPTQQQIYPYTTKLLSANVRKALQKRASSQGM